MTPIHPESYEVATKLLTELGFSPKDLLLHQQEVRNKLQTVDVSDLSKRLEVGEPTLQDIIDALKRPGRDPREDLPKPILRQDVLHIEDLETGMKLMGTVRNVVDFGAFVDIGVKQDGLIHISQLGNRFIKHPFEVVSVGDVLEVTVLDVDAPKNRISLTLKSI